MAKRMAATFILCILFAYSAFAQLSSKVSGGVSDAQGIPIIGVSVSEKGTSNGTITNLDGKWSLQLENPASASLVFSYIGYQTRTIPVNGKTLLNVQMQEDHKLLDEVVVVGYGTQKKVNLTGAVSVVKADDLKDRSALDVAKMLQGSVPGLNITTGSGRPGQGSTINIRGVNSINGGNPLVLIDGVEGNLQRINPADVESISIIKDASSAAIYGARASFGVILVTTKTGADKNGNPVVRYSGRFGFTAPTTSTEYESRGYYSVYLNNLFWKSYAGTDYASYSEADMQELWNRRNDEVEHPDRPWVVISQKNGKDVYNYYANTDWYHELYNDTKPTTQHSISLSGGSGKVKYMLSGSYNREKGMIKKSSDIYKKYNFRSKLSFDVADWLNVSNNTSYFNSAYSYPGLSGINNYFSLSTVHALASFPARNPDGTSIYTTQYNGYTVMDGLMTVVDKDANVNEDKTDQFTTTMEIAVKPTKNLEIRANYTYAYTSAGYVNRQTNATYSEVPREVVTLNTGIWEDKLKETSNVHRYHQANVFATYSNTFNNIHNFKIMAGANYETKHLKDVSATGYNLLSETLSDLNLVGTDAEGNKRMEVSGGQNEYATLGYFARLNYDYKGKYLLELNGRYDGTSRFQKGHRWGFFPSASVGWRISEEPFFEPVKNTFNNLKLRFSFDQLGNQQVGYYESIRTISIGTSNYLFGGAKPVYASISAPVASDLTWEIAQQYNLGLDMGLFNDHLSISAEAYIRDTKNMLTAGVALPGFYGASSPRMNAADLRTSGYELSIAWRDEFKLAGKPIHYNASFVFSDYQTEITKYDNPEKSFSKGYYEGMKYGEIWGYRTGGLFATDEEAAAYTVDQSIVNQIINSSAGEEKGLRAGDIKYLDLDGDGKISIGKNTVDAPGDKVLLGNSKPRYNYGATLGFDYVGFDFSIFFQGIGRMDWYPPAGSRAFWGPFDRPYMTFIPKNFHTKYWTEENPDAYFPRPRGYIAMNGSRALGAVNDRYLLNIGYCRLKNLTVGYTLPQKWTRKISIDQLRFYFSGENLHYWSPLKKVNDYIDPEMAMTGGTMRLYPWQEVFMFGVDLTF